MCYPKPGPRCSNHTRGEIARLQEVVANFSEERRNLEDPVYYGVWEELQQAKEDHDTTPEGQKELIAALEATSDPVEVARIEERLDRGIARREQQKETFALYQLQSLEDKRDRLEATLSGISIHSASNLEKDRIDVEIAENGGLAEFQALFDTDGNQIPNARQVETRYGFSWVYDNEDGEAVWFSPSKANDPERREKANAKKGYYVGRVKALARAHRHFSANSRYNGTSNVVIKRAETHGGTEGDIILDNGKDIRLAPVVDVPRTAEQEQADLDRQSIPEALVYPK